jgi:hypothetical protein
MTPTTTHRPSLVRTITLRLAITSMLAIILQVTIVVARTYFDEEDLNKSYVTREARALLYEVRPGPQGLLFRDRRVPAHYTGEHRASYAFRILDERGQSIAEHDGRKADLVAYGMGESLIVEIARRLGERAGAPLQHAMG